MNARAPSNVSSHPVHVPVMMNEVLDFLSPKSGGIYVDGTFGVGGYARAILQACNCRLIAFDRDPEAVVRGLEMEKEYGARFKIIQKKFSTMKSALASENITAVDGIVLDVGVSSYQLDTPRRGFSFRFNGPLDMRMDFEGPTAADIVNTYKEDALAEIIFHYGEERFARKIAKKIVETRKLKKIETTFELADLVRSVVPRHADGIDPATRTFQALRIFVNNELEELQEGLEQAEILLKPEGRLVVVSFHSLEDRIVKTFLKKRESSRARTSRHAPQALREQGEGTFRPARKRVLKPTEEEIQRNPRARSAKLRAAIRTSQGVSIMKSPQDASI